MVSNAVGNLALTTNLPAALEDPAKLGPKMRALTKLQQRFVHELLTAGLNYTAAARAAGYCGQAGGKDPNHASLRVTAHRLAHDERIQAAIREEAERRLNAGALLAAQRMVEMVNDPLHNKNFEASKFVLGTAGIGVTTEHKVTVERVDEADKIRAIKEMCQTLGLDAGTLLGQAQVIDVTPTPVEEEFDPEDDLFKGV